MNRRKKSEWVSVGEIIRPWGIKGEVKVNSLTDFPERLTEVGPIRIEFTDGRAEELAVEGLRAHKGFLLVKFNEIDSPEQADRLRGCVMSLGMDKVAPLPEGTYHIFDIIGMEVETDDGEVLGVIQDVLKLPASDVYVVHHGDKEFLIPAVRHMIKKIDTRSGKMVVDLPDGLLE